MDTLTICIWFDGAVEEVGRFYTALLPDSRVTRALRDDCGTGVVTDLPVLAAYVERGTARPAFRRALDAQLADFTPHAPKAA